MDAIPAYPRYSSQEPSLEFSPRIDVIRGAGKKPSKRALPSNGALIAVACAVILLVVAALAIVRIGVVTATVTEATQVQQLSSGIAATRSASAALDVSINTLASNTELMDQAAAMGMVAPEVENVVTLKEDLVATDEGGTLLLSDSIDRVSKVE